MSIEASSIPPQGERVFLITGGTAGIGKVAVLKFAALGVGHIYFTGRNAEKAAEIIKECAAISQTAKTTFLECDQTSLQSVKNCAIKFLESSTRLDVLICNAGIMLGPGEITVDGYEKTFQTNQLSHSLLVKLLMPTMQKTAETGADVRNVWLTSTAFAMSPLSGIVFKDLKTKQEYPILDGWQRYGQSKLANMLYAFELADKYPTVSIIAIHPGNIRTDLVTKVSWGSQLFVWATGGAKLISPEEGAQNTIWAAVGDKNGIQKRHFYVAPGKTGSMVRKAGDTALGAKLWDWTEAELSEWSLEG